MRVIFDTNILLAALMVRGAPPEQLYERWRHGEFDLATAERQLDELNQVSRRHFFQARIKPSEMGRMITDIRRLAVVCDPLPLVTRSSDPADNVLLALTQAAQADYLVTGDESKLLTLKHHGNTGIVTASEMVAVLQQ